VKTFFSPSRCVFGGNTPIHNKYQKNEKISSILEEITKEKRKKAKRKGKPPPPPPQCINTRPKAKKGTKKLIKGRLSPKMGFICK
jgi:hypothetical protein